MLFRSRLFVLATFNTILPDPQLEAFIAVGDGGKAKTVAINSALGDEHPVEKFLAEAKKLRVVCMIELETGDPEANAIKSELVLNQSIISFVPETPDNVTVPVPHLLTLFNTGIVGLSFTIRVTISDVNPPVQVPLIKQRY